MSLSRQQQAADAETALAAFRGPETGTREATGDSRRHTDADSIRRAFGIPAFDPDAYEWGLVPDVLIHEWDAGSDRIAGGTDLFAVGAPGSGKSTLANYLTERLVEINDEIVTWRGSPSRSEWLPLAPWATLWLPRGDVEIALEPRNKTRGTASIDVDELERIVRAVRRYGSTRELLEATDPGINVVYPDPELRGCQDALDRSARRVEPPADRDQLFAPSDPMKHWWFGWFLDRVDQGPHYWTTWVADEIGDIAPQNARKDDFGTYQKVELLKDSWVDARKHGLSTFGFGHSEADVHAMVRRKMRWRVAMPGSANPTSSNGIVGFDAVPMRADITSSWGPGTAVCYTESKFQKFGWKDTPVPHNWTVKIRPLGGT